MWNKKPNMNTHEGRSTQYFFSSTWSVPNRHNITSKQTLKADLRSALGLLWARVCLGSAMGLHGVSSWGTLNALNCEANLFLLPFFVYSNYTFRDIWSFSVVSMSALGLLWVSLRSAIDLFWVRHSRLEANPEQSQKTNPDLVFFLIGLVWSELYSYDVQM